MAGDSALWLPQVSHNLIPTTTLQKLASIPFPTRAGQPNPQVQLYPTDRQKSRASIEYLAGVCPNHLHENTRAFAGSHTRLGQAEYLFLPKNSSSHSERPRRATHPC